MERDSLLAFGTATADAAKVLSRAPRSGHCPKFMRSSKKAAK